MPLLDAKVYACDDANQQPVWIVAYYQKQLLVIAVQPVRAEVANHIPAVTRTQSMDFFSAGSTLHLWINKGANGPLIRMEGTTGPLETSGVASTKLKSKGRTL